MDILNSILAFIQNNLAASSGVIAVVVEFALRLIPSQKPLSILLLVKGILGVVGNICLAANNLLDKILPQNIAQ